jgi:hypothetical protein
MTHESAWETQHKHQPIKAVRQNLKTLLPELNPGQFNMLKHILVEELYLTDRQIKHIERLLGE